MSNNQQDKLLKMFFEPDRWLAAVEKGVDKDMPKSKLLGLAKPQTRLRMYAAVVAGKYEITPPHTAQIPKSTPGEFRTVYVNEPVDRVFLSVANDLLFDTMAEEVHPRCASYRKGISCGKVVKEVSRTICATEGRVIGFKSDLSKYFDSVPIRFIDEAFDRVERKWGHSALVDVLRKYYHSDLYFTPEGQLERKYQSLKQGCSVAAWLADVVLRHIDEKLSSLDGYYVRYSDDMIFVGRDYLKAMDILIAELAKMDMKLNPKKVEQLTRDHWFKFLGFSIKGQSISFGNTTIKKFQKEIQKRTTKNRRATFNSALRSVVDFLYKGDGRHSWSTLYLTTVNVKQDIDELNMFVQDCLRAVKTGKRKTGGLGYNKAGHYGCVERGRGRNVTANRNKVAGDIPGWLSLGCMRNALLTRRAVYETLVASM